MKSFRDNEFTNKYLDLIRRSDETMSKSSDGMIIRKAIRELALNAALNCDKKYNRDLPEDEQYFSLWDKIREEEIRSYIG